MSIKCFILSHFIRKLRELLLYYKTEEPELPNVKLDDNDKSYREKTVIVGKKVTKWFELVFHFSNIVIKALIVKWLKIDVEILKSFFGKSHLGIISGYSLRLVIPEISAFKKISYELIALHLSLK